MSVRRIPMPQDGGLFNWRRRTQGSWEREHRRLRDVMWDERDWDAVEIARRQLDLGINEAHAPLSAQPWLLEETIVRLHEAGMAMTGAGPYGPNAFLRAGVVRRGHNGYGDNWEQDDVEP
jgi:hypothetical protein